MSKQGVGGSDQLDGGGEPAAELRNDVPISEELIWKARAEEAEDQVAKLEARVVELEGEVESAYASIRTVERRGEIDRELTLAKAIDLETARLLTEAAIGEMDSPDVSIAVRELCDRKPFLFACKREGGRSGHGGVAMGPKRVGFGGHEDVEGLAEQARSSGDRGELLRYLRVRRGQ